MKKIFFLITLIATVCFSACQDSSDVDAGNGYKFSFNERGGWTYLTDNNGTLCIGEHILNYKFNTNYIVLAQRPRKIFLDCVENKQDYNGCKIEFENSTFKEYYIINKQKRMKVGPLTPTQYGIESKKLNIPGELYLIN